VFTARYVLDLEMKQSASRLYKDKWDFGCLRFQSVERLPSEACVSFCVGDVNYLNTHGINRNCTIHGQKE
jgi:hypothetical protein